MRKSFMFLAVAWFALPILADSTPTPSAERQRHDTSKSAIQNMKAREKATVTPTPGKATVSSTPSAERGKPSKEQRVSPPTVTPGKE